MSRFVLAAALAVVAGASDPAPPLWGPTWTVPFYQTITIFGFTWSNVVDFFYDTTTQPVGSSIYRHSKGQHDELCTSIKGKEFSDEPCTLLASNDTWRYVIFPESGSCCRYCNTTQYCGIIRPDWLVDNSTFVGSAVINGTQAYGWMKRGGEENYYYATTDASRSPVFYFEGYPTFDVGYNNWTFNTAALSRAPIPASTFAVPAGCTAMCETSSLTYQERLEGVFGCKQ